MKTSMPSLAAQPDRQEYVSVAAGIDYPPDGRDEAAQA
jgi:hypothetical protein